MKTIRFRIFALFLFVLVVPSVSLIVKSQLVSRETASSNRTKSRANLTSGTEPSSIDSQSMRSSNKLTQGIQDLVARGYQIEADKVGRSSGTGNVSILLPDGLAITGERVSGGDKIVCESFRCSPSGSAIYFEGDLVVWESDGGPNAYTKLTPKPGGDLQTPTATFNLESQEMVLDGHWATSTVFPR